MIHLVPCFLMAAKSACFSASKCAAFSVQIPTRMVVPVLMAAGTALARVLQSDEAYSRAEVKRPGRDAIVRKSFSQSAEDLQAPLGRLAPKLNPFQYACVDWQRRTTVVRKAIERFFMVIIILGTKYTSVETRSGTKEE